MTIDNKGQLQGIGGWLKLLVFYLMIFEPLVSLWDTYARLSRSFNIEPTFADNQPYALHDRYQVTAIYRNPDSEIPSKIAQLPMCSHERHYTKDNLNHDVFNLYF